MDSKNYRTNYKDYCGDEVKEELVGWDGGGGGLGEGAQFGKLNRKTMCPHRFTAFKRAEPYWKLGIINTHFKI